MTPKKSSRGRLRPCGLERPRERGRGGVATDRAACASMSARMRATGMAVLGLGAMLHLGLFLQTLQHKALFTIRLRARLGRLVRRARNDTPRPTGSRNSTVFLMLDGVGGADATCGSVR